MQLLSVEQIKIALEDRNIRAVSRLSGVSIFTLKNIREDRHNPQYKTLVRLTEYFTTPAWERGRTGS